MALELDPALRTRPFARAMLSDVMELLVQPGTR
jgi:hypothetical protein